MNPSFVPKFTYIIPFRFSPDRILPLKRVVEWLSGFHGVEIFIVEQDTHSKIDFMTFRANHIFIKSDAPFNKSWAYNVGMKRSTSKTIIFGDADFIMNPMELIESLKSLENYDCVIPTNKICRLTPQESSMDTASMLQIKNSSSKTNLLDGISIFKKDAIFRIAGWNEDLMGLGFENEFNELKVKKYLNYKQFEYLGYHIHHRPEPISPQLIERNKQIFDVYNNDKNLLDQHIPQVAPKIGQSSRFASFI